MSEDLTERILRAIDQVVMLYHRLVLVVAPAGAGKTIALQEIAKQRTYPYLNVNLELSRVLLELTQKHRRLQLSRLLAEIIGKAGGTVVLLDNIEILFDVSLKQDLLRLLQGLARNRTIVAAWPGSVTEEHLIYAVPDHPEYRRYPRRDLVLVVDAESKRSG